MTCCEGPAEPLLTPAARPAAQLYSGLLYHIYIHIYICICIYIYIYIALLRPALVPSPPQVYSGLLWLSHAIAEKLLELHMRPPLDACTYVGIDSGAPRLSMLNVLSAQCHSSLPGCAAYWGAEPPSRSRPHGRLRGGLEGPP